MSRPSTANNRRGSGTPTAAASAAANSAAAPAASSSSSTSAPSLADLTPLLGANLKLTLNSGDVATGLLFAFDPNLGTVALETLSTAVPAYLSASIAGGAGNNAKEQAAAAAAAAAVAQDSIRRTGFRLIKIREVKQVELGPASDATVNGTSSSTPAPPSQQQQLLTPLQALNIAALEARANTAIRDAHIRASRRGVGVSNQAQNIFDALSKTLPCRWHGTHIIVMDEIVISAPNYDGSSTNVTPYTQDQLRAALDGNPIPASADGKLLSPQAVNSIRPKAASWQRVVKVLEGERAKIQRQQTVTAS
ncbi:hypothetical protein OC846_002038 [Tilletia horrida]|uniref:AD domain-containing protein n=1 Tax=Tilletia horrida TaxID=155126 RepID=A0AAN6JT00_9BASI|nr:hypothetical protein OC845_004303 [Tilletia horrida]KAK0554562.1 hypothetical protein OC846_002038 [Tilletia horrida]KAK0568250.1 hypothetical protein OC861_002114 [Tilletia horrida]